MISALVFSRQSVWSAWLTASPLWFMQLNDHMVGFDVPSPSLFSSLPMHIQGLFGNLDYSVNWTRMCLCEMYYHDIDIYNVCAYYRNKDNIFVLLSMGMWHNGCEEGQNGDKIQVPAPSTVLLYITRRRKKLSLTFYEQNVVFFLNSMPQWKLNVTQIWKCMAVTISCGIFNWQVKLKCFSVKIISEHEGIQ